MFITHLKDNPDLKQQILERPDHFFIQEKIDGSSIIFKYEDRTLFVYRKLTRTVVSCDNVSNLLSANSNYSVLSLINAYHILLDSLYLDELEPGKEYYAEYFDSVYSISAVKYNTATRAGITLYLFDTSLRIRRPSFSHGAVCTVDTLKYKANRELRICRTVHLPIFSLVGLLKTTEPIEESITRVMTNNSVYGQIEGTVILNSDLVPVAKVIPDYEKFTEVRKANRAMYNFLQTAKRHGVSYSACYIGYYCNKVDFNNKKYQYNLYKRNLEYISLARPTGDN